jgi:hypothetical protein
MRYSKQPIDIPDQLALLKQRGMIVNNENAALRQFKEKLLRLIDAYPSVSLKQMGFPRDWRQQPLWL